jgi:hypothetical protein
MIEVNSNTISSDYLISRDSTLQWVSSGFNDDALTSIITIDFGETLPVSRIGLIEMNFREFIVYYDGVTANTFTVVPNSVSSLLSNSENSVFWRCETALASSVTIECSGTFVSGSEKAIGHAYFGDLLLDFERVPSSKNYKPIVTPQEVLHKMSDGSSRLQKIDKTFSASISFDNISETFRNDLEEIYNRGDSFVFVPFGTGASWDEILYSVVWSGPFNFYEFSDNASASGFSGSIRLSEVRL